MRHDWRINFAGIRASRGLLRTWAGAALAVAMVGCGSDASDGASDTTTTDTAQPSDNGTDTSSAGDTSNEDTAPEVEVAADPDGTKYPIAATTGVIDGTFTNRPAAAFDGERDQAAASASTTDLYDNLDNTPLLYKEFDCETALRRVEVHPSTEGHLLYHATNYPNGGTGTVTVVGRRADIDYWYTVATKPFAATGPVVFGPEDLGNVGNYVAYGVTFAKDEPLGGELRVAEVALFGYCAGPPQAIAWQTTDWLCTGVECASATNEGGLEERTVTCARSSGGYAHPDLCDGEAPADEGETCSLACPYSLTYIGPRGFTYDHGSGWLHEGWVDRRAGPLPSDVEFGTTVEAIAGKPCSVLTTDARAFFVGISCVESQAEGEETLYCAFRCE